MNTITVKTMVHTPIETVWTYWTEPKHIIKWNNASDDWHTLKAENDLRVGGKFFSRMEAKDGSFGFDFKGIYTEIIPSKKISYRIEDGRNVEVHFTQTQRGIHISETFEMENENSEYLQRKGWQAILDNFKRYIETIK